MGGKSRPNLEFMGPPKDECPPRGVEKFRSCLDMNTVDVFHEVHSATAVEDSYNSLPRKCT